MTKAIKVGNVTIGGGAPISVQSMTTEKTSDVKKVLSQITALRDAGCDLVRLAVVDEDDVKALNSVIKGSCVPLIADIQFDYRLAIKCSDAGFSKVRFNPGNIGSTAKVKELVSACKANGTAIRVGANAGSLDKKYAHLPKHEALAESVLSQVAVLEDCGFYDTVLSVKSSNVKTNVLANRYLANKCDYPLHIGVTESGFSQSGIIKSAIGVGSLLLDGIGATVRVSLTGDPIAEPKIAIQILKSLGLKNGVTIVSCPTCARCKIDLLKIAEAVENATKHVRKNLKIAVMGCVVNGPGEASDADFGIAGGDKKAVIFKKGEIIKTVNESEITSELLALIKEYE